MVVVDDEPPVFTDSNEVPPGYADTTRRSRRRERPALPLTLTEHVYTLGPEKKRPWAYLRVNSRTKDAAKPPVFLQGDKVTGQVELDLEKTEHIEAVTVQVRGETWGGRSWAPELEAAFPFWSHAVTLWPASAGEGGSKMKGKYTWPFSIRLPQTATYSGLAGGPVEFSLPPCFTERNSPICIDYKIVVTFSRGRLRLDNTLFAPFAYLPLFRPPEPSVLRQLAYRERWPPPGPQDDPEGWEVLRPASVVGTLFDARKVDVACVFALAKPLCYTRGTFVPFALTLTCADSMALDLFAARGSLAIRLMRTFHVSADLTTKPRRGESEFCTAVGTGVYWPADGAAASPESRRLEGEIPVKGSLKASFAFPLASVKYHVSFALSAPGFNKHDNEPALAFSQDVTIAPDPAPGPAPRSRAPHAPSARPPNAGIGM